MSEAGLTDRLLGALSRMSVDPEALLVTLAEIRSGDPAAGRSALVAIVGRAADDDVELWRAIEFVSLEADLLGGDLRSALEERLQRVTSVSARMSIYSMLTRCGSVVLLSELMRDGELRETNPAVWIDLLGKAVPETRYGLEMARSALLEEVGRRRISLEDLSYRLSLLLKLETGDPSKWWKRLKDVVPAAQRDKLYAIVDSLHGISEAPMQYFSRMRDFGHRQGRRPRAYVSMSSRVPPSLSKAVG